MTAESVNACTLEWLTCAMVDAFHHIDKSIATADQSAVEEVIRDATYARLECIGFEVGQRIVEKWTLDRPRFVDALDVVKFLCKDVWLGVFGKSIDNLKTNHRGVYVLQFKWFTRVSSEPGARDTVRRTLLYAAYPCGLIRGCLTRLGVPCTVVAEIANLPQCAFQVNMLQTNSK